MVGLGVVQLAWGQGKIEGAFGKKLGDAFEAGDARDENAQDLQRNSNPVNPRYRFTPVAPFQGLTDYFIEVTPTTHRIFAITASGPAANKEEARKKIATMDILLAQKYVNEPFPDARGSSYGPTIQGNRIEQRAPGRFVVTSAQGQYAEIPPIPRAPVPFVVTVRYHDMKLAQLAWGELDAIKKAKEDAQKAELAAMQKKQSEEYERKLAEEEEAWQKQLPKLREDAGKLDASGL
jgi:hypothetical protein